MDPRQILFFYFVSISNTSSYFSLPSPLLLRSTASFSYARNLQPLHHFRRVYPNEAGDTSDCELDDDDQGLDDDDEGMETFCDCPPGDDMMDVDDGPVPIFESTSLGQTDTAGLGQTDSDSNWNLHLSDEEVFPSPSRDKDTSKQNKSDQGESWKMPSFRKPRDRKSSWSETSAASSSSSRRSSRSRSDSRKGDGRETGSSRPGSDREDLRDFFSFDPPTSSRSGRRNSVPSMFDTPSSNSSSRRNSVPSARSSNSRSQKSSDENLASQFEGKLYNFLANSSHFATSSSLLFQFRFLNCTFPNGKTGQSEQQILLVQ